jgi:hypothetical protein
MRNDAQRCANLATIARKDRFLGRADVQPTRRA